MRVQGGAGLRRAGPEKGRLPRWRVRRAARTVARASGEMRPVELEKADASAILDVALIDRLVEEGSRPPPRMQDRQARQFVEITRPDANCRRNVGRVFRRDREVCRSKLSDADALSCVAC